jgi:hypothetical protein
MEYVLELREMVEIDPHEFYSSSVVPDFNIDFIRYLNEFVSILLWEFYR